MSDSPIIAEILGLAGYDHIIIDHEHSPTDLRSGQTLLQAVQAANAVSSNGAKRKLTEAIVRVPSPNDPVYMKKVLDSMTLPGGVLVPMVDSAATAEAVVASTRYPRQRSDESNNSNGVDGIRGCAAPFVRGSSWGAQKEYLQACRNDLLVMVQVETPAGVEAIPDIAAIPGIDGIFLGPFDLSCSIGLMGQFDHPEVSKLLADAEAAVRLAQKRIKSKQIKRDTNCLLAGFRPPGQTLQQMYDAGYSLVCGSLDLAMIREAAKLDANSANSVIGNQCKFHDRGFRRF